MRKKSVETRWSKAGKASTALLNPEERRARATQASRARWDAVHEKQEAHRQAITSAAATDQARYGDLPAMLTTSPQSVAKVYALLQQRQQDAMLPGRNPYQVARDDPARLWSKSVHDLLVLMRSVRENAGGDIVMLTSQWSVKARESYRVQLQAIHATLAQWISVLQEGQDHYATERTIYQSDVAEDVILGEPGGHCHRL